MRANVRTRAPHGSDWTPRFSAAPGRHLDTDDGQICLNGVISAEVWFGSNGHRKRPRGRGCLTTLTLRIWLRMRCMTDTDEL